MGRVAALHDVTEAERGGDERCVALDVGTHDEDVARLEARVVLEQAEQHLAEHLHLTGRAVAAVHLDRPVRLVMGAPLGTGGVGAEVGLEPTQQRLGQVGAR